MISDYIHINIGYAIIPSLATVHVGTKLCFTMTTHLTEGTNNLSHVTGMHRGGCYSQCSQPFVSILLNTV